MAEDLSRAIVDASRLMEVQEYSQFASISKIYCGYSRYEWRVNYGAGESVTFSSLCHALNFLQERGYTRREQRIEHLDPKNKSGEEVTVLYFSKAMKRES
mmetsp:Transcript_21366/g.62299  ORF Transcript_21366/g.62299 Transcript_21366/m.62299 type:complete len:100 (-) Transcript_21366:467-766(-)